MKNGVPSLLLAVVLLLTTLSIAPAQTNNSGQSATGINSQDWQGLRGLKPGKKILVQLKSGGTIEGKHVSLVSTTLSLSSDGDIYNLEQREIRRVYGLKGRWSRSKAARIGAVIGLVVGAIAGDLGVARRESNPNRIPSDADEIPLVAGITLGPLAGAGVGALLGGKRRGKLLYEAK
jgi:hypothetical protein